MDDKDVKNGQNEPGKETLARRDAIKRIAGALAAAAASAAIVEAKPVGLGYFNYALYSENYINYSRYKEVYANYHSYHSIYVPPPYSSRA